VINGILDGKGTNIGERLHGVHSVPQTSDEHDDDIAVAFCGPTNLDATKQQAKIVKNRVRDFSSYYFVNTRRNVM